MKKSGNLLMIVFSKDELNTLRAAMNFSGAKLTGFDKKKELILDKVTSVYYVYSDCSLFTAQEVGRNYGSLFSKKSQEKVA